MRLYITKVIMIAFGMLFLCQYSYAQKNVENLDRGVVAIRSGNGNLVSWRLFGTEYKTDIGFNVYRNGTKVNSTLLTTKTNFWDSGASIGAQYTVRAVVNGVEQSDSKTVTAWSGQKLRIPVSKPAGGITPDNVTYDYMPNDASVGDLDGDGDYEIILKWYPSNAKDNSQSGYTGNCILDAYTLEGIRMWSIDLGINIRSGAHYTQFMVYDFDLDGKAELVCKTAPGTKDATGAFLHTGPAASDNDSQDYRNSNGYILSGPEYLTIFNGETGEEMQTIEYIPPRGNVGDWGDTYGNRVDRFLACVAYLDGSTPSMVFTRGYYTRTVLAAYNWDGTTLSEKWTFDSGTNGSNPYYGQGNHNLSVGDLDGDGKDEIQFGSMAIDHDGTGLYSTDFGHGDAGHLTDMDPTRPGLEFFMPHEEANGSTVPALDFRDPANGTVLWSVPGTGDFGRGVCQDIDPNYYGYECWGAGGAGVYDCKGNVIHTKLPASTGGAVSMNMGIWWDGDLLREILDKTVINKYNYNTEGTDRLFTIYNEGVTDINGSKSNPSLVADILGDWREEVIFPESAGDALILFATPYESDELLYTLMHDPQYRCAIAWQNVGYNQPPHPGFYLGANMPEPPVPSIVITGDAANSPTGFDICEPVGWATENGGVTGGGNVTPVVVTNYTELEAAVTDENVAVVHIQGTIDVSGKRITIQDQSNKSIIGLPGAKLYTNDYTTEGSGVFYIKRVTNLIMRNITFEGPGAYDCDGYDLLCIDNCQNVWVDHCDFQDGVDGNFDIKNMSDYVSVTWCKFSYNKPPISGGPGGSNDHRYTNLIGSSDGATGDEGKLKVTFQFCWWAEGCKERMPRVRYGQIHMINNVFDSQVSNHCIRAAYKANVLVEANYFDNQTLPIDLYDATAVVTEHNNVYVNCSGASQGTAFTPPYSITTYDANDIVDPVKSCAGATLPSVTECSACSDNEVVVPENTYELENTCNFDGTIDSNNTGFEGSGFVNLDNQTGAQMTFYISLAVDATETINFRYANGSATDRACRIFIDNIEVVTSQSFANTGGWTSWGESEFDISLQAGIHKVQVVALTVEGGPNFDQIIVSDNVSLNECQTQEIQLSQGWNLISTNIHPADSSIETMFSGLDVEIIKTADGFWKAGQATEQNSLTYITAGEGYLVYMNLGGTLMVTGIVKTTHALSLAAGWNMIGCQYQTSTSFTTDFNATNAEVIKNFEGFWIPSGTLNSIENFEPGKGYFVKGY